MKTEQWITELIKDEKEMSEFLSSSKKLPKSVRETLSEKLKEWQYRLETVKAEHEREVKEKWIEENETPEKLLQFYFNARTTGMQAGGHGKAKANGEMARYWKKVLEKRNIEIPPYDENQGVFNGEGSC